MSTREDFSDLKPGDEVGADTGKYGKTEIIIRKVSRLTKSGDIVVSFGNYERIYQKNGQEYRGDRYWSSNLLRLTDEIRKSIAEGEERERLVTAIRRSKWSELPIDTLRQIVSVIDEAK